ncbi:hypothetical protein ARMGADRAFT_1066346 [Armillaria gallica]|uniref:Uncharacterized protein n=1 Tax=Armillaria gallica TaxID=47427 RepID=A0A2H3CVE5_ARMGA|nr:hypothetical protein ARMGADRAFT_1066346 [Armillaria gallica]
MLMALLVTTITPVMFSSSAKKPSLARQSRPVHTKFGNHPWMLLDFGFPYGPFCSWQTIPPDATETHTVHSPTLAAALTTLHVEILPKLRKFQLDIPRIRAAATTGAFSVVSWEGFDAIEQAQCFFAYCQYQPVKLMLGDKAPPSPTRYRMSSKDSRVLENIRRCPIPPAPLDEHSFGADRKSYTFTRIA